MNEEYKQYLGDAVYASFDGWHIWLKTGDGNNNQIALEPSVIAALQRYMLWLKGQLATIHDLARDRAEGI